MKIKKLMNSEPEERVSGHPGEIVKVCVVQLLQRAAVEVQNVLRELDIFLCDL